MRFPLPAFPAAAPMSDCAFSGLINLRHRLINDDDGRRSRSIAAIERPSVDDTNAHNIEVTASDELPIINILDGLGTNPSISVSFALIGRSGGRPATVATLSTPGRLPIRSSRAVQNPVVDLLSAYTAAGRGIRIVRTRSGFKPALTERSFQKARIISPLPMSNTSAIASCTTTSPRRKY